MDILISLQSLIFFPLTYLPPFLIPFDTSEKHLNYLSFDSDFQKDYGQAQILLLYFFVLLLPFSTCLRTEFSVRGCPKFMLSFTENI